MQKYLKNHVRAEIILLTLSLMLIILGAKTANADLLSSTSCAANGAYSSYDSAKAAVGGACSGGVGYSRGYVERATSYSWECTGWNGYGYVTTANCAVSWPAVTAPSVPSCNQNSGATSNTVTTTQNTPSTNDASCGSVASSPIREGLTVSGNLCATGNNVSSNVTFNYLNSEWRWTCTSNNRGTAICKTSCVSGTNFCPSSNTCEKNCADWCQNISGAQTDRSKYIIDQYGNCTEPKFINDFKLNPSISNSQGVCKAFWTTDNPIADSTLTCKINGTTVPCANPSGVNAQPGNVRFEATMTVGSSTYTDFRELRCTKNPKLIEF